MSEPSDFKELVAWACWEIIKGITSGERLERSVHGVLVYAAQWQNERRAKATA